MSQYNSRIYIKVKNVEDWKKLSDLNFKKYGFFSNPFENHNERIFEINGDWSCYEDELEEIVYAIDARIPDCFMIGDTTNINVDPYAFIAYKLDDEVNFDEIEGDFQWETSIDDPFVWFKEAGVSITKNRRAVLESFGFDE